MKAFTKTLIVIIRAVSVLALVMPLMLIPVVVAYANNDLTIARYMAGFAGFMAVSIIALVIYNGAQQYKYGV